MPKLISREKWNDGTDVSWEVEVVEILLDKETLSESYDRECEENRKQIEMGAVIHAFVVEKILVSPDVARSNDEEEPIAGGEFSAVSVGDKLVVLVNHREYVVERYGRPVSPDFSPWPTLINIQDCGFDVEIVD